MKLAKSLMSLGVLILVMITIMAQTAMAQTTATGITNDPAVHNAYTVYSTIATNQIVDSAKAVAASDLAAAVVTLRAETDTSELEQAALMDSKIAANVSTIDFTDTDATGISWGTEADTEVVTITHTLNTKLVTVDIFTPTGTFQVDSLSPSVSQVSVNVSTKCGGKAAMSGQTWKACIRK